MYEAPSIKESFTSRVSWTSDIVSGIGEVLVEALLTEVVVAQRTEVDHRQNDLGLLLR